MKAKIILKPKLLPKPKIKKVLIKPIQKVIKKKPSIVSMESPIIIEKEIVLEVENMEQKLLRLEKEYLDEHIQKIQILLNENLYYPRSARKRGVTGTIIVKFTLSTLGVIHSIKIIESKSEILSRAAIQTIEDLSGEFPKPNEELILHVPINYKLSI
jgi:protein TonB